MRALTRTENRCVSILATQVREKHEELLALLDENPDLETVKAKYLAQIRGSEYCLESLLRRGVNEKLSYVGHLLRMMTSQERTIKIMHLVEQKARNLYELASVA